MNKLYCSGICALTLTSLSLPAQAASYVSPTEYKDYTCEELKEDYKGFSEANLNNLKKAVEAFGTRKADKLSDEAEEINAHLKAIEKASERKGCPVKKPKEKSGDDK